MSVRDSAAGQDGNLAATYALIHSFLITRSHDKAAAAVKRAAKDIVVLKDGVKSEDIALDEIVKWWKLKKEAASASDADSDSSSDSDSSEISSDSSSDSESSSSSSSSSSKSSSSTVSSNSSESKVAKPGLGASKSAKTASTKGHAVPSVEPSADIPKKAAQKKSKKTNEAKNKEDSSSDSSDDTSSGSLDSNSGDSEGERQAGLETAKTKTTVVSVTVSNPENVRTTKKRRTSESGNAVVTAVVAESTENIPTPKQNGKINGKQPRKSNTPFQRIRADEVKFHDERLKDNAFVARGASTNDYGARANQDLIVTRGDGFRKEKNKKKRGSYRGGEITMQSHSIKFT